MAQNDLSFYTVDNANPDSGFKRADMVRMYKLGKRLTYPCLLLTVEGVMENYHSEVLKGFLAPKTLLESDDRYHLYIDIQGTLIKVGEMPNTKLKSFLKTKVFDSFRKEIFLDEERVVVGDMLFALCVTTSV
jgi:hypothetical protein